MVCVRRALFVLSVLAVAVPAQYQASWRLDLPLVLAGAAAQGFGQYRLSHMDPVQDGEFSQQDLLPWDRPFAGTRNSVAAQASDWATVLGAAPLVLSGMDWKAGRITGGDWATDVLMLSEALALQSGLNLAVRSLRIWPRPLYWSDDATDGERHSREVSGSFYSGHAGGSFTIAVAMGMIYQKRHPGSRAAPWVWASGLAAATGISTLRVVAGKHYPSDVFVGALIGSLAGWWVPWMHEHSDGGGAVQASPQSFAFVWCF